MVDGVSNELRTQTDSTSRREGGTAPLEGAHRVRIGTNLMITGYSHLTTAIIAS